MGAAILFMQGENSGNWNTLTFWRHQRTYVIWQLILLLFLI